MTTLPAFISPRKNLDSLIAAVAGFFIIILFTQYGGIGISPDSIVYTSAARNFAHNGRLLVFGAMPLVDFPVMYPLFLAFIKWVTQQDLVEIGRYINGALFGVLIYLCGCIMESKPQWRTWYKWAMLSCIAISPSLLDVYTMMWSETLFIILTILFIILYKKYTYRYDPRALYVVAFCAAVACITRYAGIALVGTGGLLLLMDTKLAWKKKIIHILIFGSISISLLVVNLVRNALITGTLTGDREKGVTPFFTNVGHVGKVFCEWISFMPENVTAATIVGTLVLVVLVVAFGFHALKQARFSSYQNIIATFAMIYVLFIIVTATLSRYETINNRFIAPAYIPLLLAVTGWIPGSTDALSERKAKFVFIPVIAIFIWFQYTQYVQTKRMYTETIGYGIPGYTDASWRNSAIAAFLKGNKGLFKPDMEIYTNANDAFYFVSGLPAESVPHTIDKNYTQEFIANDPYYIVWFSNVNDIDLLTLDFIKANRKLTVLHTLKDGVIFLSEKK